MKTKIDAIFKSIIRSGPPTDRAIEAIDAYRQGNLALAVSRADEAARQTVVWQPLYAELIDLSYKVELAIQSVRDLAIEAPFIMPKVRLYILDGQVKVRGPAHILNIGTAGPVAEAIYDMAQIPGGITIKLVNPVYRIGSEPFMTRDVWVKVAEEE